MILHPIACGVAFVAWLLSIGGAVVGSLFGVLAALVAWVLCLIVMATDFSLFGILRHHVNHDRSGSRAEFGPAMWCLCVAFILLFFAMIIEEEGCGWAEGGESGTAEEEVWSLLMWTDGA
jgi:hypothetical protein